VEVATRSKEKPQAFNGNLVTHMLLEGALTAVTLQNAGWRLWISWSEGAAKKLLQASASTGTGCFSRGEVRARQIVPVSTHGTVSDTTACAARFEHFAESDGTWRFRLLSGEGKAQLTSRSYQDARSARSGMKSLINSIVQEDRCERRKGDDGRYFAEVRAGNNRVLWTSTPYKDAETLERDLAGIVRSAREAARAS